MVCILYSNNYIWYLYQLVILALFPKENKGQDLREIQVMIFFFSRFDCGPLGELHVFFFPWIVLVLYSGHYLLCYQHVCWRITGRSSALPCYFVSINLNITYWTLPSLNIVISYSIIIRDLLHEYNFISTNIDLHFKLITCSLDWSSFVGETCLIYFVAELRTCTQTCFTSIWYQSMVLHVMTNF